MKLGRNLLIGFAAVMVCAMAASVVVHAADEINSKIELNVSKAELDIGYKPGVTTIDMRGDSSSDIVQQFTVAATSQVTVAAGVATNGVTMFQSLWTNTSHYIQLGPTNATGFESIIVVRATEKWLVRLDPLEPLFGHAVGASLNLRTLVIED